MDEKDAKIQYLEKELKKRDERIQKETESYVLLAESYTMMVRRLEAIEEVSQTLASSGNLDDLLKNIMERVDSVMRVRASSLFLIDEARERFVAEVSTGEKSEEIKKYSFKLDEGVIGLVATEGEPQIVNDAPHDERHLRGVDEVLGYKTYNILAVPMKVRDKMIGVMEVLNRTDGEPFVETDALLLSTMANQAAILIEFVRLSEKLDCQTKNENKHKVKSHEKVENKNP